ncbi:hypothetical protein GCM10008098_06460 [Rhodanobacter panaciterrae]|uniref:Uncharacterized protein n=1 Tax=Rhodanobacter panaciterrae TaxID=490572 RepID=A0ABQ2ZKD6_9GAMM|nr:hypothetical protein GCM10008098_06460 [Rhodanobacter panaciterrae]
MAGAAGPSSKVRARAVASCACRALTGGPAKLGLKANAGAETAASDETMAKLNKRDWSGITISPKCM